MIDQVSFEETTYAPIPTKFEAGTPMIAQVIGMGAALEYLMAIGHEALFSYETQLREAATEGLKQIEGLRILGTSESKGPIISFVVDGVHHLDIGTMLDLKGIAIRTGHHCCQPGMKRFGVTGTCRVSFGLYNNMADVVRLCSSLKNVLKTLR